MNQKRITDYIEESFPDYVDKILLADGLEEAFMGVVESFGAAPKACYNYDTCIDILMKQDMEYEEALEYLEFNVTQAYVGEHTPAFISLDGVLAGDLLAAQGADLGEQKL